MSQSQHTKDLTDLAAAILRFPPSRAGDLHHVNIPLRLGHGAGPLECQLIMILMMIMISVMMVTTDLITVLPGLNDHVLAGESPAQSGGRRPVRGRDKLSLRTAMLNEASVDNERPGLASGANKRQLTF